MFRLTIKNLLANKVRFALTTFGVMLAVSFVVSAFVLGDGVQIAGVQAAIAAAAPTADVADHATRTLIAAIVIGVGVTMLAAIGPARRAATVPPIAALTGGTEAGAAGSRTRKVSGFGLISVGVVAGVVGLSGVASTAITVTATPSGAIAMFLGVTLLSPLAVGVVTAVLGWPMRKLAGVAGHLAQRNAARNSRRTAITAAALMIGLALVSTALVVGESIKSTLGTTFEQSAKADYYMTDELEDVEFPAPLASEIRQSDAVDAATGFTNFEARVDGNVTNVVGFDFDQINSLLDLDVREGAFTTSEPNPVVVSVDESDAIGLAVGDVITTEFAAGATIEATIVGLFDDQAIMVEDYLYDVSVLAEAGQPQTAEWVAITGAAGASSAEVDTLVAGLAETFPAAAVETTDEFRARIVGIIVLMIVAAPAGVVAAWLPARRAGKLNVLDAISH